MYYHNISLNYVKKTPQKTRKGFAWKMSLNYNLAFQHMNLSSTVSKLLHFDLENAHCTFVMYKL